MGNYISNFLFIYKIQEEKNEKKIEEFKEAKYFKTRRKKKYRIKKEHFKI